ncbi:FadR/GntR family transcriptional regulator [Nocardioides bruguierae]|uniref:FCD domain-containing protein n=1 Tax=Nocardioides bruguierae TaxID=2945102 RepID=A0A9X2D8R5_9ACTN|nr:FCD domain-containing protein [Nocardioides bruguierae]MCM0621416.1 FCD domain-containing protein [Nocardioides bruguierae]
MTDVSPDLTPRSRAEQLAAAIERRIRGERLAPGTSVGTLEDLRASSGFSRPTVSEAVRLLRDRGILVIRPGRGGGLFVAEAGPVVRLRHTLLAVDEDPTTVVDAIELRDHLELLVASGAARCRTDEDVVALRHLQSRLADADGWSAFMAANWALHERIAAICPNAMARAVYTSTLGHLTGAGATWSDDERPDYRLERVAVHDDLVEAIAAGDLDAVAAAVRRHQHSD